MTDRVEKARERVTSLERRLAAASGKSESATPGGLSGYDSAILSGIRRKPNHKADRARFAAYDREAALTVELAQAERDLANLEAKAAREAREASMKNAVSIDDIRTAALVRDRYGWHKVVRVSAKSVTVETGFSWTERIALDAIIDTRAE